MSTAINVVGSLQIVGSMEGGTNYLLKNESGNSVPYPSLPGAAGGVCMHIWDISNGGCCALLAAHMRSQQGRRVRSPRKQLPAARCNPPLAVAGPLYRPYTYVWLADSPAPILKKNGSVVVCPADLQSVQPIPEWVLRGNAAHVHCLRQQAARCLPCELPSSGPLHHLHTQLTSPSIAAIS